MPLEITTTPQGYKVIPVNLDHILQLGGLGICDRCDRPATKFQYIGVLNCAYCQGCFDHWVKRAEYYPEDTQIEERNIHRTLTTLKE